MEPLESIHHVLTLAQFCSLHFHGKIRTEFGAGYLTPSVTFPTSTSAALPKPPTVHATMRTIQSP